MLPTLGQLKSDNSRLNQIINSGEDSTDFISLINRASDMLLQRGDWPGTVVPMRFLARRGEVVWPRYVQRVRRINHCRIPLTVGTIWYDFVDRDNYLGWQGERYYEWSGESGYGNFRHGRGFGSLVSQGRVCTYNNVPCGTQQIIQAYPQCPQDIGKTMRIFGVDCQGQPLKEKAENGLIRPGVTITLASPCGQSAVYIGRIDAVERQETQMNVSLFAKDSVSGGMVDLAIYEPSETNPSYAVDRLFPNGHRNCGREVPVICLVKMAYIPVKCDSDYVLIPSVEALALAIQAVKARESGDLPGRDGFLQEAINELNRVLDNNEPLHNTPVDEGFGGEAFGLGFQNVI